MPDNKDATRPTSDHFGSSAKSSRLTAVTRLEFAVRELRDLDYRFGGGHNPETLAALLTWGDQLLAEGIPSTQNAAYTVLGDLHNLAGWTAFDTGQVNAAIYHFVRAGELAHEGSDIDLEANIHYRIGRLHLHHGAPMLALEAFDRGLDIVDISRSPLTASILYANLAWAHATMRAVDPALICLGIAQDHWARTDHEGLPGWAGFFGENDLNAMTGVIYTELSRNNDRRFSSFAIPALEDACGGYRADMARSNVFVLIALADNLLLEGDVGGATVQADRAMALANGVDSSRIVDRLAPLRTDVLRRHTRAPCGDLRDLSQRMTVFAHRRSARRKALKSRVASCIGGPRED
ncbi:hypothetical protein AB0C24_24445 [Amycolatopsis japonica]|uniref:hypothetical protein n=1 Tax=Amycolatopsis japonica TaxID=208439 RepID=UPI0033C736CD